LKVNYWRGDWGCYWLGGARVLEFRLHGMTPHGEFDNLEFAIRAVDIANA
jgi:hypothetical protein